MDSTHHEPIHASSTLDLQRSWELDRDVADCRLCHRPFHFLLRRHHCRSCGHVVCDRCSSRRMRLTPQTMIEDPAIPAIHYPTIAQQPQRVCNSCAESLERQKRSRRMERSISRQSRMAECPMCGMGLLHHSLAEQEHHVAECLDKGSPPVRRPRYLVHQLSQDSPQLGEECPICFEDFVSGDSVARMVCLCSYHAHCLAEWLERGKGCPLHDHDSLVSF
ncbi:FYVE zinc finger-domain-containing protein [Phycomyces nitens]|nr:FYVE zinc finger-domain-containing protein [Phycomyces nitens]